MTAFLFGHAATSGLISVVLASHSPASDTVLRVLAMKAALFEKAARGVAGVNAQFFCAAGGGKLLQRIAQHRGRALPGRNRMDVKHIDAFVIGQRSKAERMAVDVLQPASARR